MSQVVMIHGIGQQKRDDGEQIRADWMRALDAALTADERTRLAHDAAMVFYGDVFRSPGSQGGDDALDDLNSEELEYAEELSLAWTLRAVDADNSDLRFFGQQVLDEAFADAPAGEVMGALAPVRWMWSKAARVPAFANLGFGAARYSLAWSLRQVTAYMFNKGGSRDEVLRRTLAQLGPETRIVIAHSLGSVVAYEALHLAQAGPDLFITIGSPLGLDSLIYQRLAPVGEYPVRVRRWVNVADPDDIVAADTKLARRFPAPSLGQMSDHEVNNSGLFAWHDATRYLSHPEVTKPIAAALRP